MTKEAPDIDYRPITASSGHDFAALGIDRTGMRFVARPRGDGDLRDGRNRCKRLAAKAEGIDAFEFAQAGDFACRMSGQREWELLIWNPTAIVGHQNSADSAVIYSQRNHPTASIDRIFEKLFNDRRRPFNHLSGCDLTNQQVREGPNRAALDRLGVRLRQLVNRAGLHA